MTLAKQTLELEISFTAKAKHMFRPSLLDGCHSIDIDNVAERIDGGPFGRVLSMLTAEIDRFNLAMVQIRAEWAGARMAYEGALRALRNAGSASGTPTAKLQEQRGSHTAQHAGCPPAVYCFGLFPGWWILQRPGCLGWCLINNVVPRHWVSSFPELLGTGGSPVPSLVNFASRIKQKRRALAALVLANKRAKEEKSRHIVGDVGSSYWGHHGHKGRSQYSLNMWTLDLRGFAYPAAILRALLGVSSDTCFLANFLDVDPSAAAIGEADGVLIHGLQAHGVAGIHCEDDAIAFETGEGQGKRKELEGGTTKIPPILVQRLPCKDAEQSMLNLEQGQEKGSEGEVAVERYPVPLIFASGSASLLGLLVRARTKAEASLHLTVAF